MGYATSFQQPAQNGSTDSIFGMVLAQSFMGMAFGAGVDQVWDAAEAASEIYTDRHSSSVRNSAHQAQNRTNGKIELGVKNSLGPIFGRQTHPNPAVNMMDDAEIMPFWLRNPSPRYSRSYGMAA